MRIMAGSTIALYNRAMLKFLLFPDQAFFVAVITESIDFIEQQKSVLRKMRGMTRNALPLKRRLMLGFVVGNFITLIFMTAKT